MSVTITVSPCQSMTVLLTSVLVMQIDRVAQKLGYHRVCLSSVSTALLDHFLNFKNMHNDCREGRVTSFMPLTVILIIISFPSRPTLSFTPDLNPSFSANPSHCSLSFFFFFQDWLHDSPDFYCYFWTYPFLLFSFSVLHFLIVVSVW